MNKEMMIEISKTIGIGAAILIGVSLLIFIIKFIVTTLPWLAVIILFLGLSGFIGLLFRAGVS